MTEQQLVNKIIIYLKEKVFENHMSRSLHNNAQLKSYRINPVLVKYLSQVLEGGYTPLGVAKALFYPRVLSTSITTSFGTQIQNMFVDLEIARGSLISGMDIEFTDYIDNRKKWCQLKAGTNTINHDDVAPLIKKFTKAINLGRTNRHGDISNNDFIVGVLYGDIAELSQHYQKIDESHPVIVGKDFWHRITGFPNFYDKLVIELQKMIETLDTANLLNEGAERLAKEINESPLFDFP